MGHRNVRKNNKVTGTAAEADIRAAVEQMGSEFKGVKE